MLFLILFHVLGVAISSRAHNENLVKAMITGKKVDRAADKRGQTTTKPSP
jgi:cytochrome b